MKKSIILKGLAASALLLGAQNSLAQINLKNCKLKQQNFRCAKNVAYDSIDPSIQNLDLWMPNGSKGNVPLVVYVHGGAYKSGDKTTAYKSYVHLDPVKILKSGKAFATINYRLSPDNPFRKGVSGEHPVQMADSAKAIQFLRAQAPKLGIDGSKLSMTGGSAGGGITLWMALHDDLKVQSAYDLVETQSSRVNCIALSNTQTTLNIAEVHDLLGPYEFDLDSGLTGLYGITPGQYNRSPLYWDEVLKSSYEEASPLAHLTKDDKPKVMMTYTYPIQSGNIHSAAFGLYAGQGKPPQIADKYGRSSFRQMGLTFALKHSRTNEQARADVTNFLLNQCP